MANIIVKGNRVFTFASAVCDARRDIENLRSQLEADIDLYEDDEVIMLLKSSYKHELNSIRETLEHKLDMLFPEFDIEAKNTMHFIDAWCDLVHDCLHGSQCSIIVKT